MRRTFVVPALADGGMTEVELGKLAMANAANRPADRWLISIP